MSLGEGHEKEGSDLSLLCAPALLTPTDAPCGRTHGIARPQDGTDWHSSGDSQVCGDCTGEAFRRRLGALRGAEEEEKTSNVVDTPVDAVAEAKMASSAVSVPNEVTPLRPKHHRELLSDTIITVTNSYLAGTATGYSYDTRNATLETTVFCDACSDDDDSDGTCDTDTNYQCLNGVYYNNEVSTCGFYLVSGNSKGCCAGVPFNPSGEGCCMTSPDVYEVISTATGEYASQQCFCSTCVDDPSPEPTAAPTPVPTVSVQPSPVPSSVPTAAPSSLPTSYPTPVPTTPAPTFKPTQLWEGLVYTRMYTYVIGGSVLLGLAICIRLCFHKQCVRTINCLTCKKDMSVKSKDAWNDMTPEEAEAKAKRDMEREIRKQEAKALQMKQFKSNNNLNTGTTDNPLQHGGGSRRAPGANQRDDAHKKDSSGEFGACCALHGSLPRR